MTEIGKIIAQLEREKAVIERALTALREIGGGKAAPASGRQGRRRGRLSAEGRRRIAEAARKRWAAKRAADAKKSAKK